MPSFFSRLLGSSSARSQASDVFAPANAVTAPICGCLPAIVPPGQYAPLTPLPLQHLLHRRAQTERSQEVTADERQKWFVGQLVAGKPLRRADLEDQFSISVATAKRDLLALRESVTFDAQSKSYRLKKVSSRR